MARSPPLGSEKRVTKMMKAALAVVCMLTIAAAAWGADDLSRWRSGRTLDKTQTLRPVAPAAETTAAGAALLARARGVAERTHEIHALLGPQHVSRLARERLAVQGLGPARRFGSTVDKAIVHVDTLRVLIVRIDFAADRSGDLTSVTTDGGFLLEADPEILFDPPPHDRDYYMAHLAGLSEYYHVQSDGKLRIEGRVLPAGDLDAYTLSDIADYGPGADGGWTIPLLETLVQDMIVAADEGTQADGDVSLADFDDDDPLTYVIFVHAGADWQSDVNRDSPNDIPTFFVSLGEPVALTSVDADSGLPGFLSECSIIPETTSQDDYIGGIAGALYHEFGHALGLPDVYDTSTGLPAVGIWDLMDSGPNLVAAIGIDEDDDGEADRVENVLGILPPSLSAWCRWYLGWLRVDELTGDEREIHLPAVQVELNDYYTWYGDAAYDFSAGYPQAIIAGSSPREFFLLENRWVPLSGADLPDVTGVGFVRDQGTGVLLYMGGDPETPGGTNWRNTGMYDFFLPAGGLLAWHVDQDRIDRGLPGNTINNDGMGLRLLEADGIQDVGVYEAYVLGFFGWDTDPFHAGSGEIAATSDHISVEGRPSTRAWDLSWTGAGIHDISGPFATMTFQGRVTPLHEGSPWALPSFADLPDSVGPRTLDTATITPFTLNGAPVLVAASKRASEGSGDDQQPWLFAWHVDGTPAARSPGGAPAGAAWGNGAAVAGSPVVAKGDGIAEQIVVGTRDGMLTALPPSLTGADWLPIWSFDLGDTLLSGPVPLPFPDGAELACQVADRHFRFISPLGTLIDEVVIGGLSMPPYMPLIDEPLAVRRDDGTPAVFAISTDEWYVFDETGVTSTGSWQGADLDPLAGVQTAFIADEAGHRVIVITESRLLSLPLGGTAAEVVESPDRIHGNVVGDPAVADLDGDGRNDLIVVTDTHIHAFSVDLLPLTGWPVRLLNTFPLASSVKLDGGLVVFDGDADGVNEVWVTTDAGHLVVYDASGDLQDRTPFLWGAGNGGRSGLAVGPAGDVGRVLWLADPGGRKSIGLGKTSVPGRLSAYLPMTETRAGGTSEWLGLGGGMNRTGTVGDPSVVAGAPAEADRDLVVVYPNPWRNDSVHFRFWAGKDGTARVTVLTIEGEVVDSISNAVVARAVNELIWTPSTLASGVYMCRFEIPDADGVRFEIRQLAVER